MKNNLCFRGKSLKEIKKEGMVKEVNNVVDSLISRARDLLSDALFFKGKNNLEVFVATIQGAKNRIVLAEKFHKEWLRLKEELEKEEHSRR